MRRLLHLVALVFVVSCGLPVNEDPEFSRPDDAGLDPEELVIGVALEGQVRAYPIAGLAPLEILNDRVGDVPIAITWCPLSASSAVFDRRVGDRVLTFRFHPDLFKHNLMIDDTETETRWSQLAQGAIGGALDGTSIRLLPSLQTTWEHWLRIHPETVVMRPNWGSHGFEYRSPGTRGADGLAPRSLTHVVWVAEEARAYPLEELAEVGGVLQDEVGGRELTVVYVPDGPTATVTDAAGNTIPGITLYREYVPEFYPTARMWRSRSTASSAPPGHVR